MTTTPISPVAAPVSTKTASSAPATSADVRIATLSDAQAISVLGTHVFQTTFVDSGPTPDQLADYLNNFYSVEAISADIKHPNRTTFVCNAPNGELQGFAMLLRNTTHTEPCLSGVTEAAEVQRIYVDHAWHGRGVAGALMQAVEDAARKEGFKHLWLGVWESNFRAQKFYERYGYRKVGEHGFDVGGDVALDWIMLKDL